jgi:hypothetical protein
MVRFSLGSLRGAVMAIGFVLVVLAVVVGVQSPAKRGALAAASDFCETEVKAPVLIKPTMPPNFVFHAGVDFRLGQALADCDAWQQFVYMNWPAQASPSHGVPDPSASFGATNIQRTVWVSYDRPADIFVAKPSALRRSAKITLRATDEFLGNQVQFGSTGQAGSLGWIVGRGTVKSTDGKLRFPPLTFYDIWVNNDEEQYIWGNKLQYAAGQTACARAKAGLQLPKGSGDIDCTGKPATYGLNVGAAEIKAALLDMGPFPMKDGKPDLAAASKIAPTFSLFPVPVDLVYPAADKIGGTPIGTQPNRLVGLVGMHIIRKIPGAQRFLWSTFEHVDNVPDAGASPKPKEYTYFDPSSTAPPNQPPFPCPSTGCNYGSSQLTRLNPIDSIATSSTGSVWTKIAASSVFRNYELVQVQWQSRDFPLIPGAQPAVVNGDFMVPEFNGHAANMTLESFKQDTTCVKCHAGAPVARVASAAPMALRAAHPGGKIFVIPVPTRTLKLAAGATPVPMKTGPPYASDFSFIFRDFAIQGTPPPTP